MCDAHRFIAYQWKPISAPFPGAGYLRSWSSNVFSPALRAPVPSSSSSRSPCLLFEIRLEALQSDAPPNFFFGDRLRCGEISGGKAGVLVLIPAGESSHVNCPLLLTCAAGEACDCCNSSTPPILLLIPNTSPLPLPPRLLFILHSEHFFASCRLDII